MAVIDIIVGGRFHSDRLTLALLKEGHDVQLITPFPKNRFNAIPPKNISSLLLPEILYRLLRKIASENLADETKMAFFGKGASRKVRKNADLVIGWSSFSLEAFQNTKAKKVLIRDSSHIETQMEILKDEYQKRGRNFTEKHTGVQRELEEYRLCDSLIVLSEFAKNSFLSHGILENKIHKLTLGTDLSLFTPDSHSTKLPLKVVYFGALSFIKGVPYLIDAFKRISPSLATLELIGPLTGEIKTDDLPPHIHYHPPLKHPELAKKLREFDVFVFPTLEDGFGQTLLQAMASGLVPVVTENCGAGEIIEKGKNGVKIPIASSESIYEAIQKLGRDLSLFQSLKKEVTKKIAGFTWENYDLQIKQIIENTL